MAKYDRRFLVPYLQDVCSIELLLVRLQKEYHAADRNLIHNQNKLNSDVPPPKVEVVSRSVGKFFAIVAGGCFTSIMVCIIIGSYILPVLFEILAFILFLAGLFFCYLAKVAFDDAFESEKKEEEYKKKLMAYKKRESERDSYRKNIASWKNQRNLIIGRIEEVKKLRERIYNINVIPHQYRNVYAAHFLYDFFRGGQEDDLEKVIGIFVLEEIKARLDKVIEQQTEMILNQRVMLANQDRMNKQIAENHEQEMRQYAKMVESGERRNQYLEMINTNLEISNYFAYNEYIKRR